MTNGKPTDLDWEALGLTGADADLAKIIAEETAAERRARKTVADVADAMAHGVPVSLPATRSPTSAPAIPLQSEYTVAEIEALSWDELLVLDGECFFRCCERSQLPPMEILNFVETQCMPVNSIAVHWFNLFLCKLLEGGADTAVLQATMRKEQARHAAEVRHNQPGGYRSKKEQALNKWASGDYQTREECAEAIHEALGISRDTARRYLRGAPEPLRGNTRTRG